MKTLAERHERMQCLLYATVPGERPPNVLIEMEASEAEEVPDFLLEQLQEVFPDIPQEVEQYSRAEWVELYGTRFRLGSAMRILQAHPLPSYLLIDEIIIVQERVFFRGEQRDALELSEEYCAFRLEQNGAIQWHSAEEMDTLHAFSLWRAPGDPSEFVSDRSI